MTTLLSRYKIIKQIGEGAFGYTYLAEDTSMILSQLPSLILNIQLMKIVLLILVFEKDYVY